jgi:hypothetical protein
MFRARPSTTGITDGAAENGRSKMSILGVAGPVPFSRVPVMNGFGPSPSPDAKRRGGSVPTLCQSLTCGQKPEPDAPANAEVASGFHSHVGDPASLS